MAWVGRFTTQLATQTLGIFSSSRETAIASFLIRRTTLYRLLATVQAASICQAFSHDADSAESSSLLIAVTLIRLVHGLLDVAAREHATKPCSVGQKTQ